MTFDLTQLDTRTKSAAGVPMTIINPKTGGPVLDSDGNPVTITLRGRNSQEHKNVFRVIQDRRLDRAARGVRLTEDEQRQEEAEFLTALTVDWTFTELDGQPFPPTAENFRKFWIDERFTWILEQATRFAANDGNFLAT
jgi:hypothetical protein